MTYTPFFLPLISALSLGFLSIHAANAGGPVDDEDEGPSARSSTSISRQSSSESLLGLGFAPEVSALLSPESSGGPQPFLIFQDPRLGEVVIESTDLSLVDPICKVLESKKHTLDQQAALVDRARALVKSDDTSPLTQQRAFLALIILDTPGEDVALQGQVMGLFSPTVDALKSTHIAQAMEVLAPLKAASGNKNFLPEEEITTSNTLARKELVNQTKCLCTHIPRPDYRVQVMRYISKIEDTHGRSRVIEALQPLLQLMPADETTHFSIILNTIGEVFTAGMGVSRAEALIRGLGALAPKLQHDTAVPSYEGFMLAIDAIQFYNRPCAESFDLESSLDD